MNDKKVLVSGCYDLLHAGHVAFFKTASQYGKLYVSVGQDENLFRLKGKKPYFSQEERVFNIRRPEFPIIIQAADARNQDSQLVLRS